MSVGDMASMYFLASCYNFFANFRQAINWCKDALKIQDRGRVRGSVELGRIEHELVELLKYAQQKFGKEVFILILFVFELFPSSFSFSLLLFSH